MASKLIQVLSETTLISCSWTYLPGDAAPCTTLPLLDLYLKDQFSSKSCQVIPVVAVTTGADMALLVACSV